LAAAAIVFTTISFFAVQIVLAQRAHREAADKGPRATGLIELAPNGKAHLIPIVIMVDGKFYDAAEYKASPVPISLDSGTIYEAFRSGVSQGLFTVRTAQTGAHTWRGDGTWQSAADIQAAAEKKKATAAAKAKAAKKNDDDQEGPPKLRRAASNRPDADKTSSPAPGPAPATQPTPSADGTKPAANPLGGLSPTSASQPGTAASSPTSASAAPPEPSSPEPSTTSDESDPDRPRLRRGAGPPEARNRLAAPAPTVAKAATPAAAKAVASSGVQSSNVQLIPAVSDAGGPEPRPYTFNMKPDEERELRTKMLALAAAEVNARDKVLTPTTAAKTLPPPSHRTKAAKAPQPTFEDVQFHVFDLSNSNEPVLIMTAKAKMPVSHAADNSRPPDGYLLTLVAREDIYGDLHKALSNVTDNQRLGVLPRLDLIDAVDVDGDGGGELLFRRVSDTGSGYVVYRVIGNQLWPLYEGPIG
jgi:hypothetical protein